MEIQGVKIHLQMGMAKLPRSEHTETKIVTSVKKKLLIYLDMTIFFSSAW